MNWRKLGQFKVWTTASFVTPLTLAIYLNIWVSVLILIAVIVTCTIYHLEDEKRLAKLDAIFAWALIGINLILCYLGGFAMPYFGMALLFVAIAVCLVLLQKKKSNYNLIHGFWHIVSALITIFSLLTYRSI